MNIEIKLMLLFIILFQLNYLFSRSTNSIIHQVLIFIFLILTYLALIKFIVKYEIMPLISHQIPFKFILFEFPNFFLKIESNLMQIPIKNIKFFIYLNNL